MINVYFGPHFPDIASALTNVCVSTELLIQAKVTRIPHVHHRNTVVLDYNYHPLTIHRKRGYICL